MNIIKEVVKVSQGKYKLNDSVIVYNFDFTDLGVTYSIDWDENLLSEDEAAEIGNAFIQEAIENKLQNS